MFTCKACEKTYTSKQNLQLHHKRQPMCIKWLDTSIFEGNLINSIDKLFKEKKKIKNTSCDYCSKIFSTKSNLNAHMKSNIICKKWETYDTFKPVYESFIAPKYKLCHIIWNIFLIDKEFKLTQEIIDENNIGYILAILPDKQTYYDKIDIDVEHNILEYEGHTIENIDTEVYDSECKKIEKYRKERKNIFVFCNSGYQRSIPFLIHYLTKHHGNEVPTIEKAMDIILPQVDKENYATIRNKYITNMELLFNQ